MIRKTLTILSLIGLLIAGCCLEFNFEEAEDSAATVEDWQLQIAEQGFDCTEDYSPVLIAGECVDESALFVRLSDGFTSETQYFDPQTGEFISVTSTVDFILPPCGSVTYWPFRFDCGDAIVTDVFCGTLVEVGDELSL